MFLILLAYQIIRVRNVMTSCQHVLSNLGIVLFLIPLTLGTISAVLLEILLRLTLLKSVIWISSTLRLIWYMAYTTLWVYNLVYGIHNPVGLKAARMIIIFLY